MRESTGVEKGRREQHIARNSWKPEEYEEPREVIAIAKAEWEVRSLCVCLCVFVSEYRICTAHLMYCCVVSVCVPVCMCRCVSWCMCQSMSNAYECASRVVLLSTGPV